MSRKLNLFDLKKVALLLASIVAIFVSSCSQNSFLEEQVNRIKSSSDTSLIFLSTDWCGATEGNFNSLLNPYVKSTHFESNNVFVYIYTNSNIGFSNTISKFDSTNYLIELVNYHESNNPIIHKREIKKFLKKLDKDFDYEFLFKGYVPVVVLYDSKNKKLIELNSIFNRVE
jgi:hypothetical protein